MPESETEHNEDLARRAADLVYSTCRRVLRDDQDAADCTQDVLARWWRDRARIRVSVFGWLQKAAHGAAVDMIRRREARRRAEANSPVPMVNDPSQADTSIVVDECLAQLGDEDRNLLLEHHFAGVGQA